MLGFPLFRNFERDFRALEALYDVTLERLIVHYEVLTVETRFGKTNVVTAGPSGAPSILLLHGGASNAVGCWPLINGLAGEYRIYAPDAPRQLGKTEPFHLSSWGSDYGMWLVDVLEPFEPDKVSVVGFSFGAWIALKLAVFAPSKIAKIVLLSPIGLAHFRVQYLMLAPIYFLRMLVKPTRNNIHAFARFISGPTASNSLVEEVVEAGKVFIKNFHMLDMPFRLSKRDLRKILLPMLVFLGQYDSFCKPRAVASRLLNNLNEVEIEIIPDVGHICYFEKPEFVNHRILEFLRRNS